MCKSSVYFCAPLHFWLVPSRFVCSGDGTAQHQYLNCKGDAGGRGETHPLIEISALDDQTKKCLLARINPTSSGRI